MRDQVWAALATVVDPELDRPLTELGFVRSVAIDGAAVEVHLRLPTSFCAPNFAWLMASDAYDAVADVPGVRHVVVELDDHHDSELINRGLAAGKGYRETFGHEALESLDELRETFRRKAYVVAMERAITRLLPRNVAELTLADVPDGDPVFRHRAALGLSLDGSEPLLTDQYGGPPGPLELRRARSVRISVEGNAHFCRGLLATRYENEVLT
ncbi:iron-sulfur cluster assembly protein [Symbioplanes lichenis]|uniref:iron-sulfur cluster assembly protein n=1 Tax=Symbioplanes lichenis TaxID=1629072 RepID=UPI00273A34A7|nr:iron-sulfur cluster assembly protein [Actinoplanes lichenis]